MIAKTIFTITLLLRAPKTLPYIKKKFYLSDGIVRRLTSRPSPAREIELKHTKDAATDGAENLDMAAREPKRSFPPGSRLSSEWWSWARVPDKMQVNGMRDQGSGQVKATAPFFLCEVGCVQPAAKPGEYK